MRKNPNSNVTPVVTAIVGNPLMSGVPMLSSFDSVSLPPAPPPVSSTTPGTVTASTSGGCTIGPNRARLCTAPTAITAPRKYPALKTKSRLPLVFSSMMAPSTAKPKPTSTAAHQGKPRLVPTARRSSQGTGASSASGSLWRSRIAVTTHTVARTCHDPVGTAEDSTEQPLDRMTFRSVERYSRCGRHVHFHRTGSPWTRPLTSGDTGGMQHVPVPRPGTGPGYVTTVRTGRRRRRSCPGTFAAPELDRDLTTR